MAVSTMRVGDDVVAARLGMRYVRAHALSRPFEALAGLATAQHGGSMYGGNQITGTRLPSALRHYEALREQWTALRARIGHEHADADAELMVRSRGIWERPFNITDVLRERMAQAKGDDGDPGCLCGGSGYSPLWVAETFDSGLNPATYARAWGWRAVYCLMCQDGAGLVVGENGMPDGDGCTTCDGTGITPAWVNDVLGGSPSALNREQTATGWFATFCRGCGGWGRVLPSALEDRSNKSSVMTPVLDVVPEGPSMRRIGDVWHASYLGRTVHLHNRVGAVYLGCLLDRPGESIPAEELVALRGVPASTTSATAMAEGLRVAGSSDLGTVIDPRALAAYKQRLVDLGAEIDQAERDHNLGKLDGLRREQEALETQIVSAVGRRGALRHRQPELTRARDSVQKAIRDVLEELAGMYPEFATHLRASTTFGSHPSYSPREIPT